MGSTTEILGAFTLVFTVFNAVLGVLLLHLSYLKDKGKGITTWIYNHAGYESLNAVRDHYARPHDSRGGMSLSHEDTIAIIQDATDVGKADWSKEPSLYVDGNDTANLHNLNYVLDNRRVRRQQAAATEELNSTLRQRNVLDNALTECQTMADGRIDCAGK
jgi:hypothetical protein